MVLGFNIQLLTWRMRVRILLFHAFLSYLSRALPPCEKGEKLYGELEDQQVAPPTLFIYSVISKTVCGVRI